MKKEKLKLETDIQPHTEFEDIKTFRELFNLLNSNKKLGNEYEKAYEEVAVLAKDLVEKKNKSSWNPDNFEENMKNKYPNISDDFIAALKRCLQNYNPVVNIPNKPLWDND